MVREMIDIKQLEEYKNNTKGYYKGIARDYYPKWIGWELIATNSIMLDEAVQEFYLTYYYYHLKLDLIDNPKLALVLMNFATIYGKNKTISKLRLVTGTAHYVDALNTGGLLVEYSLILELLEFMSYSKSYRTEWLFKAYRAWLY